MTSDPFKEQKIVFVCQVVFISIHCPFVAQYLTPSDAQN